MKVNVSSHSGARPNSLIEKLSNFLISASGQPMPDLFITSIISIN
jgi:hypothetical protein